MPNTIAIARPPAPLQFRWNQEVSDRFAKILKVQAEDHFDFDDMTGLWRPVWKLDANTFLEVAPDSVPGLTREATNRDEMRCSIESECKQILNRHLMRTYFLAHHGGRKALPYSPKLISLATWHEYQLKKGLITRNQLKQSLSEIAFFNLHPRAVAITIIEDAARYGPLTQEFPIIEDLVEFIAEPYIGGDLHYGVELKVTLAAAAGCTIELVSGHGLGHKDRFVRFI